MHPNKFKNRILLFVLFCLLIACKQEPPPANETTEPRGPLYRTEVCQGKTDYEEQRKCGDIQLVDDVIQYVFEANNRQALEKNTKLVLEFYVDENGKVQQAKVSKSVNEKVDKAALKFINKTKWFPAHDGNTEMRIKKRIPILLDF